LHAAALAALHRLAFTDDAWGEDAFATLLAQPGVAGLIDPRGGLVLFRVVADEAELLTLGVTEKRQGIGRSLLATALARLRAGGVRRLYLEVAASNVAALGLYASAGFTEIGRRPRYYPNGDDALVLCLALGQDASALACPNRQGGVSPAT
jgi:ribosomal-protein-alanine N-acetyltransferase